MDGPEDGGGYQSPGSDGLGEGKTGKRRIQTRSENQKQKKQRELLPIVLLL